MPAAPRRQATRRQSGSRGCHFRANQPTCRVRRLRVTEFILELELPGVRGMELYAISGLFEGVLGIAYGNPLLLRAQILAL